MFLQLDLRYSLLKYTQGWGLKSCCFQIRQCLFLPPTDRLQRILWQIRIRLADPYSFSNSGEYSPRRTNVSSRSFRSVSFCLSRRKLDRRRLAPEYRARRALVLLPTAAVRRRSVGPQALSDFACTIPLVLFFSSFFSPSQAVVLTANRSASIVHFNSRVAVLLRGAVARRAATVSEAQQVRCVIDCNSDKSPYISRG